MKKPVVLYGAGPQNLRIPYETIVPAGYEIIFICDKDESKWGNRIYGYNVVSPKELREFDKQENDYYLLITVRNRATVKEIKEELQSLKHAEISTFQQFYYEKKIHENMETLSLVIVHLTEHCDLNCTMCSHFSSIAEPEYLEPNSFEKDFARLFELVGDNIPEIQLLGGEPLLHPHITDFFYITRKYFKSSLITLITNGIKLISMDDLFYNALHENQIVVSVSYYGLKLDYNIIEQKMKEYGIELVIGNEGDYKIGKAKTMEKCFPVVPEGGMDGDENFRRCFLSTPKALVHGRLSNCTPAAYVGHFNKYFGYNIPDITKNGIDIYQVKSGEELIQKLKKRPPMCDYCYIPDELEERPWSVTKRQLTEWVDMNCMRGGY